MTPLEIIKEHARRTLPNEDPGKMVAQVADALQKPQTQLLQEGDCVFLIRADKKSAFMYIFNGGGQVGYLRALGIFTQLMRKLGFERLKMRVTDTDLSRRIAATAGVDKVTYKHVGGGTDPYVMTMEL